MNAVQAALNRKYKRVRAERQRRFDERQYAEWTYANLSAFLRLKKATPGVWAA